MFLSSREGKMSLPLVWYRELAPLVAQRLKRLPAMWETWVRFLGQEDPLEKEMATHSSILAWRIPWTEEPGGLQSTGSQRVGHHWVTSLSLSFTCSQNQAAVSRQDNANALCPHHQYEVFFRILQLLLRSVLEPTPINLQEPIVCVFPGSTISTTVASNRPQ